MNASVEPLVLVPGLLCSPALFEPQVQAFSHERPNGRPVIVADHTEHDRVEAIAADILSLAPPRFALAGLSMGGYVVFEMFRQAPARITRIAFLDTTARPDAPERAPDRRRLIEVARTKGVEEVQRELLPKLIHPARMSDKALVDTVIDMATDTGLDAFGRQQEAIIARPDSLPTLRDIRCPALVLVGREDVLTPPALAEEMAAGIHACRYDVIDDCGHLSTLEQPAAVNIALARWLAM